MTITETRQPARQQSAASGGGGADPPPPPSTAQPTSLHHSNNINTRTTSLDPVPIDFEECLKDSPSFRHALKSNLSYVDNLELYMSRAIKQINCYVDSGREHLKSQRDFLSSMRTLNTLLGPSNSELCKRVGLLLESLQETVRLQEIVIDQSVRTVGSSLSSFISDDLLKIKEARKSFEKISHEYEQALIRNSQPIKKQQDDSENFLIATSTAFAHTSLDLSIQLTALQSKKSHDILGSLLSLTKAHSTYFHQGFDHFEDLKPEINDMDGFIKNLLDEYEMQTRNLPSKHLMVRNNELRPLVFNQSAPEVRLEGYLFKRASNGFKVWNRRWFILKDHKLLYLKRGEAQPTAMEEDLRLLTVRPVSETERKFCFEVLSPHKSHVLQADSECSCKTWITALQAGINAAFHDTESKPLAGSDGQPGEQPVPPAAAPGLSAWSTGFSLKALQHQATKGLSAIGAQTGVTKESSAKSSHHSQRRPPALSCHARAPSGEDDDDGADDGAGGVRGPDCKVDEQGRSYAPLCDSDDDQACENSDKPTSSGSLGATATTSSSNYPKAAAASASAATAAGETNHSRTLNPPEKPQRAYVKILALPGNDRCADCGEVNPRWASINLGITLCIECAGIHRSLGVHLSKVRSLTLDTEVWSPEIVKLMLSLGNTSVNEAYLACYRGAPPAVNPESSREEREDWIKRKYLLKSFMRPAEMEPECETGAAEEPAAAAKMTTTTTSLENEKHSANGEDSTRAKAAASVPPDEPANG